MSDSGIEYSIPREVSGFSICNKVGQGGFSQIRKAKLKGNSAEICVKIISKRRVRSYTDMRHIQDEIRALAQLNHPNLVRYYQCDTDENNIYIFMEFIKGKPLLQFINDRNPIPETLCRFISKQLISLLAFLHSHKIYHRDIKPENILINKDNVIKLIDFGLCSFDSGENLLMTMCGSYPYMPPEVLTKNNYEGEKYDIWSAGVTMYCLGTGRLPWAGGNQQVMIGQIITGRIRPIRNRSLQFIQLVKSMMSVNPSARPSAQEILNSNWMMGEEEQEYTKIEKELQNNIPMCICLDRIPIRYSRRSLIDLRDFSRLKIETSRKPLYRSSVELLQIKKSEELEKKPQCTFELGE